MLVLLLTLAGCEPTEKRTGNQGDVKDVTGQKNPVTTVVKDPNPLTKEYVVYRVQKNGEEILIPEKVRYAGGKKSREEAALDALVHTDPVSKQLINLFPPGTDVISVKVSGDTATVDFNQNFASRGSSCPQNEQNFTLCRPPCLPYLSSIPPPPAGSFPGGASRPIWKWAARAGVQVPRR